MDKKLTIGSDKKLLGVCSGFAEYFGWDVTLIRIVWVVLVVAAGTGILAYLICWVLMPKK